jgi:hypothetical protein
MAVTGKGAVFIEVDSGGRFDFIADQRFLEGKGFVQIPAIEIPIDHLFDIGLQM